MKTEKEYYKSIHKVGCIISIGDVEIIFFK